MELPDCPPGAEGYQDSVAIELPKKPSVDDSSTKAEQEFKDHLNSLKIKVEDGSVRCMVERRGRDISGKWIYLCYPCAAMCSGESILQTHISGKKHKAKLSMKNVWPVSIYDDHPYFNEKQKTKADATDEVLQKMAEEVQLHNHNGPFEKFARYKDVTCHIQSVIDGVKAPLIGLEYLVEHPPEQAHYEPSYMCTLCSKQGHPRTIVNHLTCFWHRYNYLIRHWNKACTLMAPYRSQQKYREGVNVVINRLAQRIEDKFGRLKPKHIDKEEYESEKDQIHKWIFSDYHFSESPETTLEEIVDVELIMNHTNNEDQRERKEPLGRRGTKDPSPPIVIAPLRPHIRQRERRSSLSLSDVSDEEPRRKDARDQRHLRDKAGRHRASPPPDKRRPASPFRNRFSLRNLPREKERLYDKSSRPPNFEYKQKLAMERSEVAREAMKKTLAYHEKNPEKHPLYPDEWKKFWNRRYKEIQSEGKDPSKHDFKPEWILFWTARMKKLHEEELRTEVEEIYRKLCMTPPSEAGSEPEPRTRSIERKPVERRRSLERKRSPERRRSPPEFRKRPDRRRSPDPRRTGDLRRPLPDYRRDRRTPDYRRSPPPRRLSPLPRLRSRSPLRKRSSERGLVLPLESLRSSRSPLSRRDPPRNRSPAPAAPLDTVLVSDDDLHPENISPWNSDNDLESLGSLPDARSPVRSQARSRSRTGSVASRPAHGYHERDYRRVEASVADLGPAENVVATLRLLVALEDYLGSIGPKIVDLLTEALRMEKEKANSSEDLLVRDSAVVLIETAKEKLKGAVQAGLVAGAAQAAARAAVVRAANTLHAADTRARPQKVSKAEGSQGADGVPVAGVGAVARAEIAAQMAAALVAQGKTDVSAAELAQLVDAVVGMAEAKKRESATKKAVEARAPEMAAAAPARNSASALQMLQSAYDEYDKKPEKEDAPDAMDGLSDSDLETLLKNFSELSAEEQHSLIAYLKKLEAKEPQRVEKLRQYVTAAGTSAAGTSAAGTSAAGTSAAGTSAAGTSAAGQPAAPPAPPVVAVTIDSDDDDYTVEDVFKSATQKVKEDQIRQEMEIVKKSLEETKPAPAVEPAANTDLGVNLSAASELLALVQASIQAAAPATATVTATVNATATAPTTAAPDTVWQPIPTPPEQNVWDPTLNTPTQSFEDSQDNYDSGIQQGSDSGPPHNDEPFHQNNQDDVAGDNFEGNYDRFGGGNFAASRGRGGNRGSFGNHGSFMSNSDQGNFGSNQSQGSYGNKQEKYNNPGHFGNNPNINIIGNTGNQRGFGNSPNHGNYVNNPNQGNFGNNPNQGNFGNNPEQGNFTNNPSQRNFGNNPDQGNYGNNPDQGNFANNPSQGNYGNNPDQGTFGNNPNQRNFGNNPAQGNYGNNPAQGNYGNHPTQGSYGNNPNQGNFRNNQNQGNFGNNSNRGGRHNQSNFGGNKPNQNSFGNNQNMHNNFGQSQGNFGRGRGGRGQRGRGRGGYY